MLFDRVNPFLVMLAAGLVVAAVFVLAPKPGKTCFKVGPCTSCYFNETVQYPASYCNATDGQICVNDVEVGRHNAVVDLYACLCEPENRKLYSAEISDLKNALGLSGNNCDTMPSKWKERYVRAENASQ